MAGAAASTARVAPAALVDERLLSARLELVTWRRDARDWRLPGRRSEGHAGGAIYLRGGAAARRHASKLTSPTAADASGRRAAVQAAAASSWTGGRGQRHRRARADVGLDVSARSGGKLGDRPRWARSCSAAQASAPGWGCASRASKMRTRCQRAGGARRSACSTRESQRRGTQPAGDGGRRAVTAGEPQLASSERALSSALSRHARRAVAIRAAPSPRRMSLHAALAPDARERPGQERGEAAGWCPIL